MGVNAKGEGVALVEVRDPPETNEQRHEVYQVTSFGPDGKVRKEKLIDGLLDMAASVRIDNQGNVYVAESFKPEGHIVPEPLQGKGLEGRELAFGGLKEVNYYPAMCGTIIKFPPAGGAARGPEGVKMTLGYGDGRGNAGMGDWKGKGTALSGALWVREGVGKLALWNGQIGAYDVCACERMSFDVDGFGRVFAPDTVRFQLVLMDTNGNPMGRLGTFGNIDSQLKGKAALRFAWPQMVAVSDEAVYVADNLNCSILRLRVAYAAEESCAVR
jgi:hypothetical protein